jgi:hypothetical protein
MRLDKDVLIKTVKADQQKEKPEVNRRFVTFGIEIN